jgi:hypothetical protein
MSNVRIALVGAENIVENVIEIPEGQGPEYASEILSLSGNWVVDAFGEAGPGALFDQATGRFSPPDMPLEEPAE